MLRPGKSPLSDGLPTYSGEANGGGGGSGSGYRTTSTPNAIRRHSSGSLSSRRGSFGFTNNSNSNNTESVCWRLAKQKWLWTMLLSVLFLSTTVHYRGKHRAVLDKLNVKTADEAVRLLQDVERDQQRWRKDNQVNMHAQQQYKQTIATLKKDNERLREEHDKLFSQTIKSQKQDAANTAREEAMQHQIELLQNATSRESKRTIVERFGNGPHYYVKFFIKLPTAAVTAADGENNDESQTSAATATATSTSTTIQEMTVETAHLDLVPHAVHLFLEQVAHKLWDGTYFYINGPHVAQAGPNIPRLPIDNDDNDNNNNGRGSRVRRHAYLAKQKFIDLKLDQLAFPQYSPDFAHLPFTLGYAGRPGGPDFYINKGNNTAAHGPGGQRQHGLQEQADSCFARIVHGQDVVRMLHNVPTYPKGHDYAFFYKEPVEIVSAQIIDDDGATTTTTATKENDKTDYDANNKDTTTVHAATGESDNADANNNNDMTGRTSEELDRGEMLGKNQRNPNEAEIVA